MPEYNQGIFYPKNPEKYIGTNKPIYRSSWELVMMNFCDNHPNIQQWSSESIFIPYQDPFTGLWRKYIPDFFILYVDKNGLSHRDIIEIKPLNQTLPEKAKGKKNQQQLIMNHAKWQAAQIWCVQNNIKFRIYTEEQLFASTKNK